MLPGHKETQMEGKFLPVTPEEVRAAGRDVPDFVYVCGDAYVDHPSFGAAIIGRVLEAAGFVVAMLPQPDYQSCRAMQIFGRPRLGFLVSSGNIDSMVCHYTAAKKKRTSDYYSPGGKAGLRPDRAVIVYCNRIREAYGDVPIIIGGLEASLRRFAHYDYWNNRVRRSILVDSRADILSYGMGEKSILRIAQLLDRGVPVKKIRDVRGTAYLCKREEEIHYPKVEETYDYDQLKTDKEAYARAFAIQYKNNDAISGRAITEYYGDRMLVQNPPMPPLEREELDRVYALTPCTTRTVASPPYPRCGFPSPTTGGASEGAISAPWPFIRDGACAAEASRAWSGRQRSLPPCRTLRDISTTWAVLRRISATRPADSSWSGASAREDGAWCLHPANIWTRTTANT